MISRLVYQSENLIGRDMLEILDIVRVAISRNTDLQLSGVLYYDHAHFIQYLEGAEESVATLLVSLRHDRRHRFVWHRWLPEVPRRALAGIPMGFHDGEPRIRCAASEHLRRVHGAEGIERIAEALVDLPIKRPVATPGSDPASGAGAAPG